MSSDRPLQSSSALVRVDFRPVKIYRKTHQLPILASSSLQRLQQGVQVRRQVIQQGKRSGFLGFQQSLTTEERIQELQVLVTDYRQIIQFVQSQQNHYQKFFADLVQEIQSLTQDRFQGILDCDRDLATLLVKAQQRNNSDRIRTIQQDQQDLTQTAKLYACAALLMLKKLEFFQQAIARLATDQATQEQVLQAMLEELSDELDYYRVREKVRRLRQEAEEMAGLAMQLERSLDQCLGPLMALVDEVGKIDHNLSHALDEIRGLTEMLVQQQANSLSAGHQAHQGFNQRLQDWLNQSAVSLTRLQVAADSAQSQNLSAVEVDMQLFLQEADASIPEVLQQIQARLQTALGTYAPPVSDRAKPKSQPNKTVSPVSRTIDLGDGVTIELVKIEGGCFQMGSYADDDEKPIHPVTVPPFWLGKYPVTQKVWSQVVRLSGSGLAIDPSYFKGKHRPVESVNWHQAVEFCQCLERLTGEAFRLPSEAEWEYACRAGTQTAYSFGDRASQLDTYAWYDKNSNQQTQPVGQKKPNNFGLYDMHGNVWEWCADHWHDNYQGAPDDGSIWLSSGESNRRVVRGGSWFNNPVLCRSSYRRVLHPGLRDNSLGFRLVCVPRRGLQS